MEHENLLMFEDLPMDNPEGKSKSRKMQNCLSDNLNLCMDILKIEISDIHKATGIPYSTLNDWTKSKVKSQTLGHNIFVLAKFLQVDIQWLAYGTGQDPQWLDDKVANS